MRKETFIVINNHSKHKQIKQKNDFHNIRVFLHILRILRAFRYTLLILL